MARCALHGQVESAERWLSSGEDRSYSAVDLEPALGGQCRRTDGVIKLYDVRRELDTRICVVSSYFLIHSSGQGPEGWRLVVQELERRGHRVLAPALRVDRGDEGLTWHANTLVEALERSGFQPQEVVIVAHSAGGMYLPLVAERWPPRRMVFLAALIPRLGQSVMDQFRADPSMMNPAWVGKNSMDDEVALEFTLHDCPPERLDWALSTRVLFYAKRAMEEPCPLKSWPSVPSSYIACAEDRTITPAWQRRAARELLGVEPIELPGGHCPNVSRPHTLVDVLEQIG